MDPSWPKKQGIVTAIGKTPIFLGRGPPRTRKITLRIQMPAVTQIGWLLSKPYRDYESQEVHGRSSEETCTEETRRASWTMRLVFTAQDTGPGGKMG